MKLPRLGPGRPHKYGRKSRAVSVTLPEDVIARLDAIDADMGQAIVKLVERRTPVQPRTVRQTALASYGNHAVIVVTPIKALKRLPGVQLVPLGSGRALISLRPPQSVARLELDIRDALEETTTSGPERQTLEAIAEILRQARVSHRVAVEERTIIVLESKRQRRRTE